jgi:hypothetical protein
LLFGGLLIGLGGPFWYDAVNGLTNIRSIAKDISGTNQPQPGEVTPTTTTVAGSVDRPQPATPVGAFNVSQAAQPRTAAADAH